MKMFHFYFTRFGICMEMNRTYFAWNRMTEWLSIEKCAMHSLSKSQQTIYWDWINQQMGTEMVANVMKMDRIGSDWIGLDW